MSTLNPQGYTLGEEVANAVTHGLGAAAAIVALTLMLVKAMPVLSGWQMAGVAVYGGSMIALFLSSALPQLYAPADQSGAQASGSLDDLLIDRRHVYPSADDRTA